jgi:hypothetical protein
MRCRGYEAWCLFAVVLFSCALQAQQPLKHHAPSSSSSANLQNATAVDPGAITGNAYRNPWFQFTYKLPFGWVDRTREMSEDSNHDSSPERNPLQQSILLLAGFEHPPEAASDSVNSAVVIAAEAASSYPGLRSAEQYFEPLTELMKAKGLTVVNQPSEFRLGAVQLVRGDFSKARGNLTLCQSTLVMMEKGYVVSFTLIGGSEDEVDQLIEGLSFDRNQTPARRP